MIIGDFMKQQRKAYRQVLEIIDTIVPKPTISTKELAKIVLSEIDEFKNLTLSHTIRYLLIKGHLSMINIYIALHPKATNIHDIGKPCVIIDDGSVTLFHDMYFDSVYMSKYSLYLYNLFTKVFGPSMAFDIQDIIDIELLLTRLFINGHTPIKDVQIMTISEVLQTVGLDLRSILNIHDEIPVAVCNIVGLFALLKEINGSRNIRHKLTTYLAYQIIMTYSPSVPSVYHMIYEFIHTTIDPTLPRSEKLLYNLDLYPSEINIHYCNIYTSRDHVYWCRRICKLYVDEYIKSIKANTWLSENTKKIFIRKLMNV